MTAANAYTPLSVDVVNFVPVALRTLADPQRDIPRIAKDPRLVEEVEASVRAVPTTHRLQLQDARHMTGIEPESVHLILTSPPYWTLKEYRDSEGQLGAVTDYEKFLAELVKVWAHCFRALAPGGRLICVVGDVCLSRRRNNG